MNASDDATEPNPTGRGRRTKVCLQDGWLAGLNRHKTVLDWLSWEVITCAADEFLEIDIRWVVGQEEATNF